MNHSRWALRYAALAAAGLAAAATLPSGLAAAKTTPAGPTIKLIRAQRTVNVPKFGKFAFVDPGVYVVAVGSALRFDVQRASYAKPITSTQVITSPGGQVSRRPVPAWTLHGWAGLRRFLRLTIRNTAGKIVGSQIITFCPGGFNPQRSSPDSPPRSPFPAGCLSNPFELGGVWGLQRGWGTDPASFGASRFRLRLGTYLVNIHVMRFWQRFLHVTPKAATATVKIHVVKPRRCGFPCPGKAARRAAPRGTLPKLPATVPLMPNPPKSALPDLTPLPSWNIRAMTMHRSKTTQTDQLVFGATVWIGGHARLDVEGFRSHGSPVMKAYQYFYRNGRVIGRVRAGTMGFDGKRGHDHWHFEQFARYRLLNAHKKVIITSNKIGFCIAPTDPINLLLPHAMWRPTFTGFGGACGDPASLWVRESLPLGWGDTYFQFVAGQSFNITKLPNGTYYIEVIANPLRVLHESNYRNDVSLRKVILGGTPGHRTVQVPAVHGIDPEH